MAGKQCIRSNFIKQQSISFRCTLTNICHADKAVLHLGKIWRPPKLDGGAFVLLEVLRKFASVTYSTEGLLMTDFFAKQTEFRLVQTGELP